MRRTASGSSPLTRGKHGFVVSERLDPGLIPAHAGKTCPCPASSSTTRAHPRSRGENLRARAKQHPKHGSSPLTRGKHDRVDCFPSGGRLIPAHAGKTPRTACRRWRARAHPRSRGENTSLTWSDISGLGSSPLTRGKHLRPVHRRRREGLIPAHAGKTLANPDGDLHRWAHPRSRGENTAPPGREGQVVGSSPLTRGKPSTGQELVLASRAHPRSRGENSLFAVMSPQAPGSSPLTRGKPVESIGEILDSGLIPAHAGKTEPSTSSLWAEWAHPRSRGENNQGSPIIMRIHGLIPAHAGKTARPRPPTSQARAHPRSRGENT